jgi:uncharacterized protein
MLLKPTWYVSHVQELPLATLQTQGIKALLMDLDDTLMPHKQGLVPPEVQFWLKEAKLLGFSLIVITNNHRPAYREMAEKQLGFPVWGPARKPSRSLFKKALLQLGLTPKQALVIGDRPLTDIWAGIRLGCPTALVASLSGEHPNGLIRFLLAMERCLIRH